MKNALLVFIAVLAALAVQNVLLNHDDAQTAETETAYERVMRTNTLRCAYVVMPPVFIKDQKTGVLSGITHDIVEAMAKNLRLKVEWVEEVGFGTMFEGFKTNRYDAICASTIQNATRARAGDFVVPFYYLPFNIYMLASSSVAAIDKDNMNVPSFRFAAMDGAVSDLLTREDFPKATIVSNTELSSLSELMVQVATGKADAVILDAFTANLFAKNNPNTPMKAFPYRVYPASMIVAKGEYELKQMLDIALQEIQYAGHDQEIIQAYEKTPGIFLPNAKPYQVP